MTKEELLSVGLFENNDGWYYTSDWALAFNTTYNTLWRHSEVNGSLTDPIKIDDLNHLSEILILITKKF